MTTSTIPFDETAKHNVDLWLNGNYDEETKAAIKDMLQDNPKKLVDAFYTNLSFGTGGLRGIMGIGTNRMNVYTVRAATQGLANYLKALPLPRKGLFVFIGYDSRLNSRTFAEETAKVFAGNGIKVFLFSDIRPVPLVSFGCRYKNCSAGIMITASHNPPEYNGYKVYWNDGGQVLPPHDRGIIKEVEKIISPSQIKIASSLQDKNIEIVQDDVENAYLDSIKNYPFYPEENKKYGEALKIVYTSLHGTGITLIPKTLALWGFQKIILVDQQVIPDGHFSTVKSPNPEDREALSLGIESLKKNQADILIATDPDADRVGVAVSHKGDIHILNGNQIASICLQHICQALTEQKQMPGKEAFIKSVTTTELFRAIADFYRKNCVDVLTGFKYFAQKIQEWELDPEGSKFIFGGEESYGYLLGTHCRDKDAIISCALICEIALHAKRQGKTLVDLLYDLYRQYGVYVEKLFSIKFEESKEGKEKMAKEMKKLKEQPPKKFQELDVEFVEDYDKLTKTNLKTGIVEPILLPKTDMLLFWLADGTKLVIRPSGTEPKIKIYCGAVQKKFDSIPKAIREGEELADTIIKELQGHFFANA